MNDFVIAVYRRDNYAGDTILILEKVFCSGEISEIPDEYLNFDYAVKIMQLTEVSDF